MSVLSCAARFYNDTLLISGTHPAFFFGSKEELTWLQHVCSIDLISCGGD